MLPELLFEGLQSAVATGSERERWVVYCKYANGAENQKGARFTLAISPLKYNKDA